MTDSMTCVRDRGGQDNQATNPPKPTHELPLSQNGHNVRRKRGPAKQANDPTHKCYLSCKIGHNIRKRQGQAQRTQEKRARKASQRSHAQMLPLMQDWSQHSKRQGRQVACRNPPKPHLVSRRHEPSYRQALLLKSIESQVLSSAGDVVIDCKIQRKYVHQNANASSPRRFRDSTHFPFRRVNNGVSRPGKYMGLSENKW